MEDATFQHVPRCFDFLGENGDVLGANPSLGSIERPAHPEPPNAAAVPVTPWVPPWGG